MKTFYTPDKMQNIKSTWGKPFMRFHPHGEFSHAERITHDIPFECMAFKIDYPSNYIVFSRFSDKNEWHANTGERYVIRELLRQKQEE